MSFSSIFYSFISLFYALLILAGGITGYLKAQSVPSLLSALLLAPLIAIYHSKKPYLAMATVLFSLLFFSYRTYKTTLFFPSGFMVITSTITLLSMAICNKLRGQTKNACDSGSGLKTFPAEEI